MTKNNIEEVECCCICGMPLLSDHYVHKNQDNTYSHLMCKQQELEIESVLYGEVVEAEHMRKGE